MKNIQSVSLWSLLVCALAMIFTVTACSDDDNHTQNDTSDSAERYEKLSLDSLRYELLLRQLCDVESLYNATKAYTPRHGEALHAATPTIYYVGVDTLPQALATWQSITSAVRDSASATAQINEVSILNMHLSYTEGDTEDEIARIDVECPELANVLTCIVFIPAKRWPSNDKSSPFGFLSVWKDSTGYYYLCVQKAQGGKGILLSFDGRWEFESTEYLFLWKNTAHGDAFAALAGCINYNSTAYSQALKKLKAAAGPDNPTYENLDMLSNLNLSFYDTYPFVFANDYSLSGRAPYYNSVVNYSSFKKQNEQIICKNYQMTFRVGERPDEGLPSRAIYFRRNYNNSTGWTCIYKGR